MCSDRVGAFKTEFGCITCLSLFYDEADVPVQWVVDEQLLKTETWRVCAGCKDPLDHTQHNTTDISLDQLQVEDIKMKIIKFASKILFLCQNVFQNRLQVVLHPTFSF